MKVAPMVDIHSHILPGLDDGAQTMDDSLAMLQIAAAGGTTDIVATPHANTEFTFDSALIARKLAELTAAAGPSIRIYTGCDFHLQYENIQDALENPTKYTINHKNYLLVEFSDLMIFNTTGEIFYQLRSAGMVPVVTHPERNWLLQKRFEAISEWVAEGACLQVTAQSFLGRFGRHAKEYAEKLMKAGMVHFVASDAHGTKDRTPDLRAAFDYVSDKYGPKRAELLFVINPRAALEGERLPQTDIPDAPPQRQWYRFWR
jgi:protein-tyrosine phosphatase